MTEINDLLHRLGFEEVRLDGDGDWEPLNGHFSDRTTDDLKLILRPADREGIAHVLGSDGELVAVARKESN
jgi:hypothetical protein